MLLIRSCALSAYGSFFCAVVVVFEDEAEVGEPCRVAGELVGVVVGDDGAVGWFRLDDGA